MLKNEELTESKSLNKSEAVNSGSDYVNIGTNQAVEYDPSISMRTYNVIKRVIDFSVASILLLILAPILAVVAIAVKLDSPGPVFYKQARIGKYGKTIWIYRFRTMHLAVDKTIINNYFSKLVSDPNAQEIKTNLDPRVTRVGKFLRQTSLDELPQFFNVIKGDMSFVGPRPLLPFEVAYLSEEMKKRFDVVPGITGLMQIAITKNLSYKQLIEKDVEYVYQRSILLDLEIIIRTPIAVLSYRSKDKAKS